MTQSKEKARPAGCGKLAVEYVPIDSVKPSPKNTRTHPPEQVTKIAASIKANDWTKPIIVDEKGEILAGHGKDTAIHPTMKPVELARKALNNSTLEGQIVLDMFSGSGSTIMGAEQTRRVGYAVELDPLYADASIRRWQNMTGKAATHAAENKTFDATAKSQKA